MRKIINKSGLFLMAFMLIAFTVLSIRGETEPKYTAGMTVAAKWLDDNYYLAKIKNVGNGQYEIEYADGAEAFLAEGNIEEIPSQVVLAVGDKVLAVWPGGTKLYPGTVHKIYPDGVIIVWDDGDSASKVQFGKIIKK